MSSEVNFLSEVSHAIDLKAEMTSQTQILTAKQKSLKSLKNQFQEVRVRRNKNLLDEVKKKHCRTSPEVQFKEFSLTKQKTRPSTN